MNISLDSKILSQFVPLSEMSPDNLNELVKSISIEILPAEKKLFNRGDQDNHTFYLLNGELDFFDAAGNQTSLNSNSKKCRFPLEHNTPRQKSAISKTEVHYIKINNDLLDVLLTWDQNKNYIVNEIGIDCDNSEENDWMTRILQSKLFHKIPPANIQSMFQRMESVPVSKNEVIMKQGDKGDYYYLIKSGTCSVYRNAEETDYKDLLIAELVAGNSFGEDALTSDSPRNATVTMNSDGVLMRLSKKYFDDLLKQPILQTVSYEDAQDMVVNGAIWLDVRLLAEHHNNKIPGSMNIPLFLLRLNADKLSVKQKYVVYCDTGSRSASATFILNENGLDAFLLEGGLLKSSFQKQESAV